MSESTLSLTWGDIRKTVARWVGYTRDSSKWDEKRRIDLKEFLRTAYNWVCQPSILPGESTVHLWSWRYPTVTIKVRASVSDTLLAIPTRISSEIFLLSANTDTFTSTMVGERVVFADTENEYEIVEYVNTRTVRVRVDDDFAFGAVVTATPSNIIHSDAWSDLTATTALFDSDMVGDTLNYDNGSSYTIQRFVSTSRVGLTGPGAASEASGDTFVIERAATVSALAAVGSTTRITATASVFRQDNEDDSDTIVFGATSNEYTVSDYESATAVIVTGNATGESDSDDITIKKSGTASGQATSSSMSLITVKDEIVLETMENMYARFAPRDGQAVKYQIVEYVDGLSFKVDGDASRETGEMEIVHQADKAGAVTTTSVESANSVFVAAHVGRTIRFDATGDKFIISALTSASEVAVLGKPSGDSNVQGTFAVMGSTAQAADDAFTVTGSGYVYDLPEDFGGMSGDMTFEPLVGFAALAKVSDVQIRQLRQQNDSTARPKVMAVRLKSLTTTERAGQRFELLIHPEPDQVYTLSYRYFALPNVPSSDDAFPLGGAMNAELILQAALAVADERVNDSRAAMKATFLERLATAIQTDRQLHGPSVLGIMTDPSMPGARLTREEIRRRTTGNLIVQGTEIVP